MRSVVIRCLAVMSIISAGLLARAVACPFCSAPSLTLGEQLAAAESAALVQWAGGKEANRDEGFTGTTDYEVLQVVRDGSGKLKKGEKITVDRYRAGKPGELFLLLGTEVEGTTEWSSPLEVTEGSFQYIIQAPSKEARTRDRLAYFMKFLEYPEEMVASDAYGEFANSPYDEIVPLADQMPREKLREWLNSKETPATRLGLYGLMLGLCGKPEDADFLKEIIVQEPEDFRLGIDGIMGGYLVLTGKEGLDVLSEKKLANPDAHFSETFAAMQALRFMWTYGNGRISPEGLRQAMRLLLARPNLADLVIVDLARWNDWEIMPHLMELYDQKEYQVPSVKRAIVRFMLIAEKDAPKEEGAQLAQHVIDARKNLEILREKDPKTVKAAERYFFD